MGNCQLKSPCVPPEKQLSVMLKYLVSEGLIFLLYAMQIKELSYMNIIFISSFFLAVQRRLLGEKS